MAMPVMPTRPTISVGWTLAYAGERFIEVPIEYEHVEMPARHRQTLI